MEFQRSQARLEPMGQALSAIKKLFFSKVPKSSPLVLLVARAEGAPQPPLKWRCGRPVQVSMHLGTSDNGTKQHGSCNDNCKSRLRGKDMYYIYKHTCIYIRMYV